MGGLQEALRQGAYWITRAAGQGAAALQLDEMDILECVMGLTTASYFKTMPSRTRPGCFQDVYRPRYQGLPIYLKLQMSPEGRAVVISFKRDERT